MSTMFDEIIDFIRDLYPGEDPVPLHTPRFFGNEKKYLSECIDSTYVSSVGRYVSLFEAAVREFTGAAYAVAVSTGTAALHVALMLAGVKRDDEVITQPLTFVATANAIRYCGAEPVFVDVERDSLGIDPDKLDDFLERNGEMRGDGYCYNRTTGRMIAACVPMHTFGHCSRMDELVRICRKRNIAVVEDAAEALGSFYKGLHAGLLGDVGIFSFNGNKTVTTGGGGMIVTNDAELAQKARHLTTTAKQPHSWEFYHDIVGYNYRMPNINAALGCAQMEYLPAILSSKRRTAAEYLEFFQHLGIDIVTEPKDSRSNYWLNAIVLKDRKERDSFLKISNAGGVQTRPVWTLMTHLPMYRACQHGCIEAAGWIEERAVNIPSSVRSVE